MGSTVRSVFGRQPLNIPPPVVCWVIPIGIIDDVIIIKSSTVDQTTRWNEAGYVLSTVVVSFTWRNGPPAPPVALTGKFWTPGLVPAQPIDPINDKPLPMPYPPEQSINVDPLAETTLVFGTPRYDDTVVVRVSNSSFIFGNKYIKLGMT